MSIFPAYTGPNTGQPFVVAADGNNLVSANRTVPIVGGIPRFVSSENYAASFGHQWLTFARTQLDSVSGHPITEDRLFRALREDPAWLRGKLVLEAGCGAGRFTEVLLKYGARVDSIDLSRAVEANKANCPTGPDHRVTQADIYALPFPRRTYDLVMCLGVVQHTPDPGRTISTLASYVKPGGQLVFDHYVGGTSGAPTGDLAPGWFAPGSSDCPSRSACRTSRSWLPAGTRCTGPSGRVVSPPCC